VKPIVKRFCRLLTLIPVVFCLLVPVSADSAGQWETSFDDGMKILAKARSNDELVRASRKFEHALKMASKSDNPRAVAEILNQLAVVSEKLGRLPKAIDYRERAATAAAGIPDQRFQAETLAALGTLCQSMGLHAKAIESLGALVDLRQRMGEFRGVCAALNTLGQVSKDCGKYADAAKYYEKSLQTARQIKDQPLESIALADLGSVNLLRGAYTEAEKNFQEALAAGAGETDPSRRELALINLGHLSRYRGEYSKAAHYFEQALDLVRATRNPQTECVLLYNLGELCSDWGQQIRALDLYRESLRLARQLGDAKSEGLDLTRIGSIYAQQRKYEKALDTLLQARTVYEKQRLSTDEVDALLGQLYLDVGEVEEAEHFIKKVDSEALSGLLFLAKADYSKALKQFVRLEGSAGKTQKVNDLFAAYLGQGKAYEGKKEYEKAEKSYEKAMGVVEDLRSSLLPFERRSFLSVRVNGFYRSEPAKGLTRLKFKEGRPAESIVPSELARARALADRIALGSDRGYSGVPQKLLEEEVALVSRLAMLKKSRACCPRESDPERYENLTRQIVRAQKELDAFVDTLWREYTQYAAVKYPRPISPDDWTAGPEEHVVVFDVLDEGVGIKLFKGRELKKSEYVLWNSIDLVRAVVKFRRPFERVELSGFDPELARKLYERLLGSVLRDIPAGTPLILVPDDMLAELPFEALVVDGTPKWTDSPMGERLTGLTYLVDRHPVSYYQSLTALTLQRKRGKPQHQSDEVLVLADPVFTMDDPRAKDAGLSESASTKVSSPGSSMGFGDDVRFDRLEETQRLAKKLQDLYGSACSVYSGFDAGKGTFFSQVAPDLHRYSLVVFATHGVYGTTIPGIMEPVLTLTMVPPGADGFLRMSEVMSLNMDASAVVLAACQTGLGEYLCGEGVLSMGRAFQYAGARTVLMTLWSVDERAAINLVEGFLRAVKAGKGKLEALAEARSEIRRQGYDHPFFWAPFILVGEAG